MKYNKRIVPSILTMLNLFFGFFSIISAIEGKFVTASWLIFIAVLWDGLDGKVARFTNTESDFGVEFDSLTDVVSFGVAPGVLIYQVFLHKFGAAGIIAAFFPLLFGAIRLARFNVMTDGSEKSVFSGLPIPVMAGTIASYVIFNYDLWEGLRFAPALFPLVGFLCFLMVSHVEYEALPRFSFKNGTKNTVILMILLTGLATIIILRQKAIFPVVFGFVLSGFLRSVFFHRDEEEENEILDISITD